MTCIRERSASALPTETSTPLPFMAVEPPENTLFSFKKEIRRGKIKKIGKGFFWWGERARAPAGVGAELRDFLGNRFGLRRKIAPKIRSRTGLDSLRAVKDGNVRKRTLRPNRVRVQFHDVVIAKDKAEDGHRLYL